MYSKITKQRWNQAQKAERKMHTFSLQEGINYYKYTYENYFKFLGLGFNLHGLGVVEVGPADFPALHYCNNWSQAWVVEPMPSENLEQLCKDKIGIVKEPLEYLPDDNFTPSKNDSITEVWLFNVMQHIIDPDLFIEKCKAIGDRIRFFEPIDYPTCEYHPHQFSLQDFKNWFGECTNFYKGGSIHGFHESDCAYGTFIKK